MPSLGVYQGCQVWVACSGHSFRNQPICLVAQKQLICLGPIPDSPPRAHRAAPDGTSSLHAPNRTIPGCGASRRAI
eukprot:1156390-Pelagomonas_calceolata.AAC.9